MDSVEVLGRLLDWHKDAFTVYRELTIVVSPLLSELLLSLKSSMHERVLEMSVW